MDAKEIEKFREELTFGVSQSERDRINIICELALDGLKYREVKDLEVLGYSMSVEMYLNEIIRPKD